LVGNAIKFTEQGEVKVQVRVASLTADDVCVHVAVIDTGVGIPAEKHQLIFEPFTQADGSTTRRYGGTGLGLSIAKQLVELMQGRLWVDSHVGQGSAFHFTARFALPCSSIAAHAPGDVIPRGGLHILLAEDDIADQARLVQMLEHRGHRVRVVATGRQAVEALARQTFDVVLLDVRLPDLDGLAATAVTRARESGTRQHLPIIGLSPQAAPITPAQCLEAGMDACLLKPLAAEALYAAIDHLWGQKASGTDFANYAPVDVALALRAADGDHALFADLVEAFAEEYPKRVAAMREAIGAANAPQLEQAALSFKAAASLFGAQTAQVLAAMLESMGHEARFDDALGVLQALERELAQLQAFLRQSAGEHQR
jgi:CheY-like chemotaxis protein/HPt (histidine-containing phosphotransfer) domain-containing protein